MRAENRRIDIRRDGERIGGAEVLKTEAGVEVRPLTASLQSEEMRPVLSAIAEVVSEGGARVALGGQWYEWSDPGGSDGPGAAPKPAVPSSSRVFVALKVLAFLNAVLASIGFFLWLSAFDSPLIAMVLLAQATVGSMVLYAVGEIGEVVSRIEARIHELD